jgi:acetyltransferase-like isoleucine patch superfamily enzyme
VSIGKNFRTDGIPRIIVDKGSKIMIGHSVEFRRSIEIRAHGNSQITIGDKTRIDRGVRILSTNTATIQVGEGTRIGLYSVLNGGDSISIGNKVLISGFVYLQTSLHEYASKDQNVQDQGYRHAGIVLEQDCWLGAHVVVLPGIKIGRGSVVGSNAVVTKNIEQYTVVAGVPAKSIKER